MQHSRTASPIAPRRAARPRRSGALRLLAGAALAVGLLSACGPQVTTHGHMVEERRLSQIQVGVSSRNDVAGILGTPSATGTFDEDVWYYIGQRTERQAFFAPDVTDRKVVAVHFNSLGLVADVQQLDLADGQSVQPVGRETPTLGRRMTVLEQFLGNLGRFEGQP